MSFKKVVVKKGKCKGPEPTVLKKLIKDVLYSKKGPQIKKPKKAKKGKKSKSKSKKSKKWLHL